MMLLLQDLDLESFTSHAFSLSPAQGAAPEAGAAGGGGAPLLLASLPDAPKIRVIVRKRPLNKKVCDEGALHRHAQSWHGGGKLRQAGWHAGGLSTTVVADTALPLPPGAGAGARRVGRAGVRRPRLLPLRQRAQGQSGPHQVHRAPCLQARALCATLRRVEGGRAAGRCRVCCRGLSQTRALPLPPCLPPRQV